MWRAGPRTHPAAPVKVSIVDDFGAATNRGQILAPLSNFPPAPPMASPPAFADIPNSRFADASIGARQLADLPAREPVSVEALVQALSGTQSRPL